MQSVQIEGLDRPQLLSGGAAPAGSAAGIVDRLRLMATDGLSRMFDHHERLFVFRVRRTPAGMVSEGLSLRYTAISLIGLSTVSDSRIAAILGGPERQDVCAAMLRRAALSTNLGDVALCVFAAHRNGVTDFGGAHHRLASLDPVGKAQPIVEVAWTLSALCEAPSGFDSLRDVVAGRLMETFNARSGMFPHVMGQASGIRSHVSCFADLIYPIQALAKYAVTARNQRALDIAAQCATRLCSLQGEQGQWWWHYDFRTGAVLERYPVYAIHQDAMGPMGLFALRDAGGPDFDRKIIEGLRWLVSAPELNGGSLIDDEAGLIWRKVARREPGKAVRYMQATASRIHRDFRLPAMVETIFPPVAIDYEDRPYHLGWLLHAWNDGERVL